VVVPTYNRARLVTQAVSSVLAQTCPDFEVLVVDDGSTDETPALMANLRDPRVRYIRGAHAGVSAARNTGIRASRGEVIGFLDSDDLWKPTKLAREAEVLAAYPEVDVVFADVEKWDGAEFTPSFMRTTPVFSQFLARSRHRAPLVFARAALWRCLLEEVPIKTPVLTVRRHVLERAGLFNEAWSSSEDWELLLRLAEGALFAYIDEPLAVVRITSTALHRTDFERGHRAMLELLGRRWRTLRHPDERAAAARGISALTRHLADLHLDRGRRLAAVLAYLRGFWRCGDRALLLRAIGGWLPRRPRAFAAELARRWASSLAVTLTICAS
jgi:glycosyltransferase involved in cell wall biosynthesis